jgi:hypothetical protein
MTGGVGDAEAAGDVLGAAEPPGADGAGDVRGDAEVDAEADGAGDVRGDGEADGAGAVDCAGAPGCPCAARQRACSWACCWAAACSARARSPAVDFSDP